MAGLSNKLVDTTLSISSGGRCDKYWTPDKLKSGFIRYIPHLESDKQLRDLILWGDVLGILKRYHIVGLEFGNWVNQNARHNFFAAFALSLEDMDKVLGFKRNIGFNNLKVAYGARGSGGAAAHFEPGSNNINMTKFYGMGSFAHEYGHFLDCFVGMYLQPSTQGPFLTGKMRSTATKPANPFKEGSARDLMHKLIYKIMFQANGSYTKFYKDLRKMPEYWKRRTEIFARVFEQWVGYKLAQIDRHNHFLAKRKYEASCYMDSQELNRVMPEMEALMKEIKRLVLE